MIVRCVGPLAAERPTVGRILSKLTSSVPQKAISDKKDCESRKHESNSSYKEAWLAGVLLDDTRHTKYAGCFSIPSRPQPVVGRASSHAFAGIGHRSNSTDLSPSRALELARTPSRSIHRPRFTFRAGFGLRSQATQRIPSRSLDCFTHWRCQRIGHSPVGPVISPLHATDHSAYWRQHRSLEKITRLFLRWYYGRTLAAALLDDPDRMDRLEDRFQESKATHCGCILDSHCGCGYALWSWTLTSGGGHLAADFSRYRQNYCPQCASRASVWFYLLAMGIRICHGSPFLCGHCASRHWRQLGQFHSAAQDRHNPRAIAERAGYAYLGPP
jgi:hypothetical protein